MLIVNVIVKLLIKMPLWEKIFEATYNEVDIVMSSKSLYLKRNVGTVDQVIRLTLGIALPSTAAERHALFI